MEYYIQKGQFHVLHTKGAISCVTYKRGLYMCNIQNGQLHVFHTKGVVSCITYSGVMAKNPN